MESDPREGSSVETTAEPAVLRIVREPTVYLVGRQVVDDDVVRQFLQDHEASWETDTEVGAERLIEAAGRVCYMSFGLGRKTNAEYIGHLVSVGHGSVLEHAVWNLIIAGVSRSFTHELIRHRAGFGYSQLSQRYVDESTADFVEPDVIADDTELHAIWMDAVQKTQEAYRKLVEGLTRKYADVKDRTLRRKLARQAARSVLPNATETKIFVTANARALRHFIEMRASEHAELEIRKVAAQVLRLMQIEAPNVFGDYKLVPLDDGTEAAETPHRKV
ncbi:MAG: FAD-dependent thymidylate synthase [Planctomycetes bacterium]|nr:FAD-dependent thymidylate synthase [Planctomycetota bacterium]